MRKVAMEMKKAHPVVAYEFELANMQLQMGLDRVDVLRELGKRNGEDSLSGLVSVLIQANRFGSSIGEALRTHSDAMRVRRRQIADEKASKCAVKLIFPLVLFIFPGIFVILVGPAAIAIVEHLMPVING
jgi:tight adherence protein C